MKKTLLTLIALFALDAGTQKIDLETSALSAGLYFVNVNVNGVSKTLRLNIAH